MHIRSRQLDDTIQQQNIDKKTYIFTTDFDQNDRGRWYQIWGFSETIPRFFKKLRNTERSSIRHHSFQSSIHTRIYEHFVYSQFCYYIQQDEQKRRATMHINRKPAEQVEVDWAGDPAHITDPDTGEILDAHIFVGVMTYSQYPYVEAFMDEKQPSWIAAHVHMYEYFCDTAKVLPGILSLLFL